MQHTEVQWGERNVHRFEIPLAEKTLTIEAGRVAEQANGSVLMSYGDTVVMEPTLAEALEAIFEDGAPPPTTTTTTGPDSDTTTTTVPPTTDDTLPSDPDALILQAQDLYDRALAAQRAGDWAEYGRLLEELGTVLNLLATLTGQ